MTNQIPKTALITGATEGIGLEFARLLAKKGYNLILVARNEPKLKKIADEFSAQGVKTQIYAKDLSILSNAGFIYDDLKTNNTSVDLLINNAGFGINDAFLDIDWQKEQEMYNLNMLTLAYFTKVFARDMVARGYGRILNVASIAAFQPGPYMAGYSATKAFVLSLSEAVNYELKGTNVSVSALCPGVTDSLFHQVAQSEQTSMSKLMVHATPKEVAEYGIRLMIKGKPSGIYGLSNKILIFTNRFVSRKISTFLSGQMLKKKV